MKAFHAIVKLLAPAAVGLVLAACETPPARPLMSAWEPATGFGYSERRLDAARFEVSFTTPFVRTVLNPEQRRRDGDRMQALAYDLGLWRAAEIAIRENFAALAVEDRQGDITIETYEDAPQVQRYGLAHKLGGVRYPLSIAPSIRSTWIKGKAVLVIALKKKAGKGDLDARATAAQLAAKHANARSVRTY